MSALRISLPANFTPKHEQVVIEYLAGQLVGKNAWQLAFEAFDQLDGSAECWYCKEKTNDTKSFC